LNAFRNRWAHRPRTFDEPHRLQRPAARKANLRLCQAGSRVTRTERRRAFERSIGVFVVPSRGEDVALNQQRFQPIGIRGSGRLRHAKRVIQSAFGLKKTRFEQKRGNRVRRVSQYSLNRPVGINWPIARRLHRGQTDARHRD
jgi:hypothetical protein